MNLTKFSPLYGAPIWNECASPLSGEFHEDWRLMNCLNFAYLPRGFASREEMDALYNEQVLRFYRSKPYRRRFVRRLWQHRWSLWHLVRNAPRVMQAKRYFSATREHFEHRREAFPLHPRQPQRLTPLLGHEPPPLWAPVRVVPSPRARQDQELPERP
jgi:anaerobic magnesium-protoporphyrin IX monomethyl ester cyclase